MDKLDQFIKKWTNIGVDTDGAFGFQCMDLMHQYCVEVLGLTDLRILAQPNAKSVYLNFNNVFGHEKFDQIANTPTNVPLKGDIMLYGNAPDGHVDIFVQGDVNSYRAFSQNLPTGSKSVLVNHPNYANVLGWLRLKPAAVPVPTDREMRDKYNKDIITICVQLGVNQDDVNRTTFIAQKIAELLKRPTSCPTVPDNSGIKNEIIALANKIG